jgi:glutamate dehydrogenase
MDGSVGLAQLAGETDADVIGMTHAFTRLGEALGIDWVQSTAARMNPSDPWERLLVSESARDLQQMRLAFLSRAGSDPAGAFVDAWLAANADRVSQFRRQVSRAQTSPAPSAAMIGQLSGQARTLLGH